MKSIFKTGTFLTAKNLNLAQMASGLSGIVDGCDVSLEDNNNTLHISKGLVKLDDGVLLEFDGTEILDISTLQSNKVYYVCAIEYSSFSIDYAIVETIPEYSNVILAIVTKDGNSVSVENQSKSLASYSKQYLSLAYLKDYFTIDGTKIKVDTDEYGLKNLSIKAFISSLMPVVSSDYYISFIANSALNKISIRGKLVSPNSLYVSLFVNNGEKPVVSTYAQYLNTEDGFVLSIPYNSVSKNDKCKLKITLLNQQSDSAEFNLYEIILN